MLFDLILLKIEDFMKYFFALEILILFHDRPTCQHYYSLEVVKSQKYIEGKKKIRVPGIPRFCQFSWRDRQAEQRRARTMLKPISRVTRMVAETRDPWNSNFFWPLVVTSLGESKTNGLQYWSILVLSNPTQQNALLGRNAEKHLWPANVAVIVYYVLLIFALVLVG